MALISVIIAVYNDWTALDLCLSSIARQTDGPEFEVIVVDDGSNQEAPISIRQWSSRLRLSILRQAHGGISSARNHGIQNSEGSILLFIDADSRLQADCLSALASAIAATPTENYFQLRLIGSGRGVVGRAEQLRLLTLQAQLLQANGRIRYLNTAGFATRRSQVDLENGLLFDTSAVRAEDTLLLANLIEREELPFFVTGAIVEHDVPLSLIECLRKDIRSALLEAGTFDRIASKGIRIQMTYRQRLKMLRSMWKASKAPSIGRSAWVALTVRQSLQRITSLLYPMLRSRYDSRTGSVSGGARL